MTQSNERAQRGKAAEKAVQTVLGSWNKRFSDFAYLRMPDARAAMGRMKAMPADYLYFNGDFGGFIEVKETRHEIRLAKDKLAQLSVLRKFALAGARSVVLVYHSTLGKWRIAKLEFFNEGVPSWDLSSLPLHDSAEEAMGSINWR